MTSAATETRKRCVARRKDGQPCQSFAVGDDGLCMAHGPRAREMQRAGGAATSNAERAAKALPSTMRVVAGTLLSTLPKVAHGEYTPAQGTAIASIASALVRVYQVGEYEDRIRTIERWAHEERLWRDNKGRDRGPIQWPDDLTG